MQAVVVIPARWASTRFPGKPLTRLCGRSMIEWVYLRAKDATAVSQVVVATDDERIQAEVQGFGGDVIMTRADHPTGTDRIAEAVESLGHSGAVINVQGDEPLIDPAVIDGLIQSLQSGNWDMVTAACACATPEEVASADVVKAVFAADGRALYFSRLPVPYDREGVGACSHWRHLGIYGYTSDFLKQYVSEPPCPAEEAEKLEQLRALHIGCRMQVQVVEDHGIGVDTPGDVEQAESMLREYEAGEDSLMSRSVKIGNVRVGGSSGLLMIAGPCVIESDKSCFSIAKRLAGMAERLQAPLIFKASYDKANRSSVRSYRGPGLEEGCELLAEISETLNVPVLTDVHSPEEALYAASHVDVIQIPAFLCRQTDLLLAAGESGAVVNIKKGQFMAPADMKHAIAKVEETGNKRILITERGATFGYNDLVADMRSLILLQEHGYPVIFDATHSVQIPGGAGDRSGGRADLAPHLARAAVATGCDGLFIETHPEPAKAKSDRDTMIPLSRMSALWKKVREIDELV